MCDSCVRAITADVPGGAAPASNIAPMKILAATAATALALLGLGAAAAPAQPNQPEVGNFVTLKLGPTQGLFRGAVHSQQLKCVANRKVRIVKVEGDSATRIARGLTSNDGH